MEIIKLASEEAYDYKVNLEDGRIYFAENSKEYKSRTTFLYDEKNEEVMSLFIKELENDLTFYIFQKGRVSLSFEKVPYRASRKYQAFENDWIVESSLTGLSHQLIDQNSNQVLATIKEKGLGYSERTTVDYIDLIDVFDIIGITLFLIKRRIENLY